MWFAPISGIAVMAPVRALMPTLIGTMDIRADEFATLMRMPPRRRMRNSRSSSSQLPRRRNVARGCDKLERGRRRGRALTSHLARTTMRANHAAARSFATISRAGQAADAGGAPFQ